MIDGTKEFTLGNTPLHVLMSVYSRGTADSRNLITGMLLQKAGGNVNSLNADLWAPIHLAVRRDESQAVNFMVRNRWIPNINSRGFLSSSSLEKSKEDNSTNHQIVLRVVESLVSIRDLCRRMRKEESSIDFPTAEGDSPDAKQHNIT